MQVYATRALTWERDGGVSAAAWLTDGRRRSARFFGNRTRFETAVGIMALALDAAHGRDVEIQTDCEEAAEWFTAVCAGDVVGHSGISEKLWAFVGELLAARGKAAQVFTYPEGRYSKRMEACWFLASDVLQRTYADEIKTSLRKAAQSRGQRTT